MDGPDNETPQVGPAQPWPEPEARARRPGITGHPVTLADGKPWLLADAGLAPIINRIRDDLYDRTILGRPFPLSDIHQAAWVCLLGNYDLADDEIPRLLAGAEEQSLVDATLAAVLGPEEPERTFTGWALSALHANGLDPAKIPNGLLPLVLEQLTRTGRAVPEAEFIASAVGAAKRRDLLRLGASLKGG